MAVDAKMLESSNVGYLRISVANGPYPAIPFDRNEIFMMMVERISVFKI